MHTGVLQCARSVFRFPSDKASSFVEIIHVIRSIRTHTYPILSRNPHRLEAAPRNPLFPLTAAYILLITYERTHSFLFVKLFTSAETARLDVDWICRNVAHSFVFVFFFVLFLLGALRQRRALSYPRANVAE